jgi:hypothetical protein
MMHDIIYDPWSMGIVSRELVALYEAFVCGQMPALPPLPIQNGDYVAWQVQRAEAGLVKELAYWEHNLRGAPDLPELPTDLPRPRVQSYRGARKRFRLSAPLAESLRNDICLEIEVEYNTDLFDEQRILRMVGHYQTLLVGVVADPDQCLAKLPLLPVVERRQLLVNWNSAEAEIQRSCASTSCSRSTSSAIRRQWRSFMRIGR